MIRSLNEFDPLPQLGPVRVPEKAAEPAEWVQVPGEPLGIQVSIKTGMHRNVDTSPMAAGWAMGLEPIRSR